nr:MAG TPA: chromosome partitioning protein [Caudoviricetes sp.]
MAFDITAAIHGPAEAAQPQAERIRLIPLDAIQANDKNFYEISGIRNLAESISIVGLLDPVRVVVTEDRGYRLVSGHRRLAAYQLLRDEAHGMEFDKIPSIIMSKLDTLDEDFALLTANATARELSYADKLQQEKAMRETLLAMKAQGRQLPSGLSQYIADSMGVSRNEVSRMHTVNENLVPEAMEKVTSGELNASEAYQLARKPEVEQKETVRQLSMNDKVYQKDVDAEYEQIRKETDEILFKMDKAAPELCREIQLCGSKKDAVGRLKQRYRNYGHYGSYCISGSAAGIIFGGSSLGMTATISYSQVFDYLALWAIRKLAASGNTDAESAWQTGTPPEPGYYTCKVDCSLKYKVMYWGGDGWRTKKEGNTSVLNDMILAWTPVPEEE